MTEVIWVLAGLVALLAAMLGAVAIVAMLFGFSLYRRLVEKGDAR